MSSLLVTRETLERYLHDSPFQRSLGLHLEAFDATAQTLVLRATYGAQVERTAEATRWRGASDLNWRRLKYWRRLAMQALEPASAPGAAQDRMLACPTKAATARLAGRS